MNADLKALNPELIIGITGHRSVEATQKNLISIDLVLEKLLQAYPNHEWRVLSPLAEGADRIVTKRIRQSMVAKLVVVLPLALDEYQKDFSTYESKQEFLQLLGQADDIVELVPSRDRDKAYAQAGQYILEHCDVLVAIWDGKPARGKGGTGEIVEYARERGLPIAWIRYQHPELVENAMISLERDQARICFERFPSQEP